MICTEAEEAARADSSTLGYYWEGRCAAEVFKQLRAITKEEEQGAALFKEK
jgi:hypothetical protein